MKARKMMGNNVMVRLDPENDIIITKSGIKFFVDTSFEPEKHIVRIGEVTALPDKLTKGDGILPWETEMELQAGDRVLMYFLAIQNCLAPEKRNYIRKGKTIWIFIKYHNIYAAIREGKIIPINGYILVEPIEDPEWLRLQKESTEHGLKLPDLRGLSKTNVIYGKIAYIGNPNKSYNDSYKSDEFYDLSAGDRIIMKKIRDIPAEYEYHAKLDNGRKLYRLQRHDILAKL